MNVLASLSLRGRINFLMMNILPYFLYVFQNIPLAPPEGVFEKITPLIRKFTWNKKCRRVCQSLLHLLFDTGGLKCPDLSWYNLSAQLSTLRFYFSDDITSWMDTESQGAQMPLHLYLHLPIYPLYLS